MKASLIEEDDSLEIEQEDKIALPEENRALKRKNGEVMDAMNRY